MLLIYSASSFCLLFCFSNIVVFSVRIFHKIVVFLVRIFHNSVVGHEFLKKCCAMELVSERCIVSFLDRVVVVKPIYSLLFLEIQSPKGHLN